MKIRRYTAPEVREALRQVREELGADAVILSNRSTGEGVELVAAIDYEETLGADWAGAAAPAAPQAPHTRELRGGERRSRAPRATPAPRIPPAEPASDTAHLEAELQSLRDLLEQQLSGLAWGELGRRNPVRAHLTRRLLRLGLSKAVADELAAGARPRAQLAQAWPEALRRLAAGIATVREDPEAGCGVMALVGPTGVGKTTTIAKLAARYRMRHGADSVALLTTDNLRVAAHEQLRTYGQLMDLPVAVCTEAAELADALERYRHRALVLIDTAGLSQRDSRIAEQTALLEAGTANDLRAFRRYLVLSATTAHHGLEEIVGAHQETSLDGCILTKIDEATGLGGILSVLYQHQLPAVYTANGQRVPEDLAAASPRHLVATAVSLARAARRASEEALELTYGGLLANA